MIRLRLESPRCAEKAGFECDALGVTRRQDQTDMANVKNSYCMRYICIDVGCGTQATTVYSSQRKGKSRERAGWPENSQRDILRGRQDNLLSLEDNAMSFSWSFPQVSCKYSGHERSVGMWEAGCNFSTILLRASPNHLQYNSAKMKLGCGRSNIMK